MLLGLAPPSQPPRMADPKNKPFWGRDLHRKNATFFFLKSSSAPATARVLCAYLRRCRRRLSPPGSRLQKSRPRVCPSMEPSLPVLAVISASGSRHPLRGPTPEIKPDRLPFTDQPASKEASKCDTRRSYCGLCSKFASVMAQQRKGCPPSLLIPLKLPNVRPPPSTHGLPWTGWARIGSCCPIWERRVASKKLIHIRASPEITKLKNKAR